MGLLRYLATAFMLLAPDCMQTASTLDAEFRSFDGSGWDFYGILQLHSCYLPRIACKLHPRWTPSSDRLMAAGGISTVSCNCIYATCPGLHANCIHAGRRVQIV